VAELLDNVSPARWPGHVIYIGKHEHAIIGADKLDRSNSPMLKQQCSILPSIEFGPST
jgi:hypothetical protein